ncbi:ABC transporter substrate-binding protein [Streptomyces sp. NPDC044780]|uniref:ABC transporter substrate-binding protein n=1 Tax=unclassified Streptomyces TaxID=2593676 RepID=UPI003400FBAE
MTHDNPAAGTARRGARPRPGRGRRLCALASAAVFGSTLLTACGSDSSDGLTSLTVGAGGNIYDMPLQVAEANGYFRAQGLKVKLVTLTASTGPAALHADSVQFLHDSPTGFLSAVSKGIPEIAVAADGGGNPLGIVVGRKFAQRHGLTARTPAAQVAKALADSTGGISSANTKAEAGIFLKAHGVDPGEVKWATLPSPAADKAALNSGQIDWFITNEPIPLQVQSDGDGVVVADPDKVPEWSAEQAGYGQFVVAEKSYATDHPEIVTKFVTAVQRATDYMSTHVQAGKDKALVSVAQKALPGVPAEALRSSLRQVEWPRKVSMTAAGWTSTLGFVRSLDTLAKDPKITSADWTNTYLP